MDKQTLSNYGWLVIVTLILAIMLAFATPFGTYVGDGVVSIANGFAGASDQAIDEDNIKTNGEKWDSKFDYSVLKDTDAMPGAKFSDGTFLTWDKLLLTEDGKYGVILTITGTNIGNGTFDHCTLLTNIIIPNSITSIGDSAFSYCSALTNITIPESVTSIGFCVFCESTNLKTITYLGTTTQWENISKGQYWNAECSEITVVCTDGTITIPAFN